MLAGGYLAHDNELKLWPYVVAAAGAYGIDKVVSLLMTPCVRVIHADIVDDDKVMLEVAWDFAQEVRAGQYFYVRWSGIRFHPVSVERISDQSLSFVVSIKGPGTQALYDLVAAGESPRQVLVQGPFGQPIEVSAALGQIVTISSGSGASPFVALLSELGRKPVRGVVFVMHHSERDWRAFERIIGSARTARMAGVEVVLHLHITGDQYFDVAQVDRSWIEVHHGRIDIDNLEYLGMDQQFYFCGNRELVNKLERHARNQGWVYEVKSFSL